MSLSGRSGRSRGTLPVLGCGRVAVKPTRTLPPRDAVSEAQHHQSRLRGHLCLREGDSRATYARLISTGSGIHDRRRDCVNTSSERVSVPDTHFTKSQFPVLHFGSRPNGGWSLSLRVDGGRSNPPPSMDGSIASTDGFSRTLATSSCRR